MLEHIDRAIHEDGHRTRELIHQFMIHTERKLDAMAIDTKQILDELRAQRTALSGVLLLCATLKAHVLAIQAKQQQGADISADLQAMHDLLAQNNTDIAQAVIDDADPADPIPTPAPGTVTNPPSETGDQTGAGTETPQPIDGSSSTDAGTAQPAGQPGT